ncbi:11386_t:CDS:2, partial [Rhizophagus irregularis]
ATGSLMRGTSLHKKATSNPWEGVGISNKGSKGNKGTLRESVSEEQQEKYSSLETSVICKKVQLRLELE